MYHCFQNKNEYAQFNDRYILPIIMDYVAYSFYHTIIRRAIQKERFGFMHNLQITSSSYYPDASLHLQTAFPYVRIHKDSSTILTTDLGSLVAEIR